MISAKYGFRFDPDKCEWSCATDQIEILGRRVFGRGDGFAYAIKVGDDIIAFSGMLGELPHDRRSERTVFWHSLIPQRSFVFGAGGQNDGFKATKNLDGRFEDYKDVVIDFLSVNIGMSRKKGLVTELRFPFEDDVKLSD